MNSKPFDAVAWMRKRREEISLEIRELGWEESYRKTMTRLEKDPLWQRLKDRVAAPDSQAAIVAQAAGRR